MFNTIISAIKGLFHVDVQISFEGGTAFSIEAEISVEVVQQITENEAVWVWSDFWGRAIHIRDLEYFYTDTNGVAGYHIAGTTNLVWRDQLTFVEVS